MSCFKLLIKLTLLSIITLTMTACAGFLKSSGRVPPPLPFEEGVTSLANRLLKQIEQDRQPGAVQESLNVMLIPFSDADSDQVPEISRRIEAVFFETGSKRFGKLNLARLTYQNIDRAAYIISGTIGLKTYPGKGAASGSKQYRVEGDVRKRATATILGQASVWIADQDLNYTPTAIYRDSPLYLKGSRLRPPEKSQGKASREKYFDVSLETRAILIEGRMAYEKGDYEAARKLFSLAAERRDGQDLGTYAGLYLANSKLGRQAEADRAFRKVVSISVEKYRYLTAKYLFKVDSEEFLTNPGLKERYEDWIRHIGDYFQATDHCLRIVGHASRTGETDYNEHLSLKRAKAVQKRLSQTFPSVYERSTVEGKGFSQNIVGTGTDNERDELDRRVELFIVDCKK
jgi:outer membrane protein OmpA-like peptidoglycan-associated protein